MTRGGAKLLQVLGGEDCVIAAPVFDPLSTRLAAMRGWDVCKLSGTVWKGGELALPDDLPVANMTDLVEIVRRILRVADVSLIVDADDGGGSAATVLRTVRELEAAGVAGIEIEDDTIPERFGASVDRHDLHVGVDKQAGILAAAVAARVEASTAIISRTMIGNFPLDETLHRISIFSGTGVDGIMIGGLGGSADCRADIRAIRGVTDLPLLALGLPWEVQTDAAFLRENGVRVRYISDFPLYRMALRGMEDCLAYLEDGGDPHDLDDRMAPMSLVRHSPEAVTGSQFYRDWSLRYDRE